MERKIRTRDAEITNLQAKNELDESVISQKAELNASKEGRVKD